VTGRYGRNEFAMLGGIKRTIKGRLEKRPTLYNRVHAMRRAVKGGTDKHHKVVRLTPEGPCRGNVLVSLINEPFLRKPDEPISHAHTHDWETVQIVQTWLDMGYAVDIIRWTNNEYLPDKDYAVFIDARANLERLAPRLNAGCVKVMHIDTAHWLFHSAAQYQRLLALEERRGVSLPPWRLLPPNRGIETADCATILGNAFTESTYAFAKKPIIRTPISTTDRFDWPEGKDWERARRHFVWFGSDGMVHKGLDLVLEAFSGLPDYRLTVCGPVSGEKDFETAYNEELYHTPNIETLGWVDLHGAQWTALCRTAGQVVYPSCSEGGGGSVITCMHAAMAPVVTPEASVDTEDFGVFVSSGSVEAVREAVSRAAEQSADEAEHRARAAWDYVRRHHTREHFAEQYRSAAEEIAGQGA